MTALAEYEGEEPQEEAAFEEDFSRAAMAQLRSFMGKLQQLYRKGCDDRTRAREKLMQVLNGAARLEEF